MNSTIKYPKAEKMFSHLSVWLNVPEKERKELYDDIISILDKKEKEDAKNLRKRNIKVLKDILESMAKVSYKTRWSEAQKLLFKDPYFTQDLDLQNMDKEDALIVFEEHIRALEKEHIEDVEKKKKWIRRQDRKNRDSFLCLLDELNFQGKLTPMSTWVEQYSTISADERFNSMLYQQGSTSLDLFKLYVDDLKARYHEEKKVIKEILKEKKYEVELSTSFESFSQMLNNDKRIEVIDHNNIKLTFNSLMEKVQQKEREKQKEELKKVKKLEQNFKNMLKKNDINETDKFEIVKEKFSNEEVYLSIQSDQERERLFNDYITSLQESCLHHIKKRKEKKRKSKRSRSKSTSPTNQTDNNSDDDEQQSPIKLNKKDILINDDKIKSSNDKEDRLDKEAIDSSKSSKKHKKSKKRKRQKSASQSASEEGEERMDK